MEQESIDYNKVLADLEAKRDALNDAIEGIRKMLGVVASPLTEGLIEYEPGDIRAGVFLSMNIGDAAMKLLTMRKQPMSTRAIADALEQGGFHHTSKNFINTVNTALYRLGAGDDPILVRVGREWGLRTWYPGWRRPKGKGEDSETVNDESESTGLGLSLN